MGRRAHIHRICRRISLVSLFFAALIPLWSEGLTSSGITTTVAVGLVHQAQSTGLSSCASFQDQSGLHALQLSGEWYPPQNGMDVGLLCGLRIALYPLDHQALFFSFSLFERILYQDSFGNSECVDLFSVSLGSSRLLLGRFLSTLAVRYQRVLSHPPDTLGGIPLCPGLSQVSVAFTIWLTHRV